MRKARDRDDSGETIYVVWNEVCGQEDERPFGELEKRQFVRALRRWLKLYTVRVVSYSLSDRGFQLVCAAPAALPGRREVIRRCEAFYGERFSAAGPPRDELCAQLAVRMRDISCFMKDLQQSFTCWFNRTRRVSRRGTLWRDRFRSRIAYAARAIFRALLSTEFGEGSNAEGSSCRRVPRPFTSFGQMSRARGHPFSSALRQLLAERPLLAEFCGIGRDMLKEAPMVLLRVMLGPGLVHWDHPPGNL